MTSTKRTVYWTERQEVVIIDQRKLPLQVGYLTLRSVADVVDAVRSMAVRGAPAIGATGAFGMALAAVHFDQQQHTRADDVPPTVEKKQSDAVIRTATGSSAAHGGAWPWAGEEEPVSKKSNVKLAAAIVEPKSAVSPAATNSLTLLDALRQAKNLIDDARPTAVNLSWATLRILAFAETLKSSVPGTHDKVMVSKIIQEAQAIADEDVEINQKMASFGATVVPDGANILHHCNTGRLATVDIGTALGVIYECHKLGKNVHVWVDETRPRLQGARLTAYELMEAGVPMHLIADSASGLLMMQGKVDIVLFGADRVAANGDVVNKVGTYKACVLAKENGVAAYAVVPTSTIDLNVATGMEIEIEERSGDEITDIDGVRIAPPGCQVYNPAFDITPYRYLTGIITECGICYPPFSKSLKNAKDMAEKAILDKQRASAGASINSTPAPVAATVSAIRSNVVTEPSKPASSDSGVSSSNSSAAQGKREDGPLITSVKVSGQGVGGKSSLQLGD